jgi:hypothetical protein
VSIHKKLVLQGKGISEEGGDRPQASERARQRLFSFSVCQVCERVCGFGCLCERARCFEGARRFFPLLSEYTVVWAHKPTKGISLSRALSRALSHSLALVLSLSLSLSLSLCLSLSLSPTLTHAHAYTHTHAHAHTNI